MNIPHTKLGMFVSADGLTVEMQKLIAILTRAYSTGSPQYLSNLIAVDQKYLNKDKTPEYTKDEYLEEVFQMWRSAYKDTYSGKISEIIENSPLSRIEIHPDPDRMYSNARNIVGSLVVSLCYVEDSKLNAVASEKTYRLVEKKTTVYFVSEYDENNVSHFAIVPVFSPFITVDD